MGGVIWGQFGIDSSASSWWGIFSRVIIATEQGILGPIIRGIIGPVQGMRLLLLILLLLVVLTEIFKQLGLLVLVVEVLKILLVLLLLLRLVVIVRHSSGS